MRRALIPPPLLATPALAQTQPEPKVTKPAASTWWRNSSG